MRTRLAVLLPVAALSMTGCGGGGRTAAALTAPTIANLQLTPGVVYVSAAAVTFSVGFDLFDPNIDVASATFVLRDAGGQLVDQQTLPLAATAASERIQGGASTALPQAGTFTVELWTTDAASLLSNALTATVDVVPYPWTDIPVDPVSREGAAAVALDGQVFVIGGSRLDFGIIPGPSTHQVERFDPAGGTWATTTALQVPRRWLAAAVAGGRILAIGGESTPLNFGLGSLVATVEEFDPVLQTWTMRASMPTPRERIAAATVAGRVYVVGGGSGQEPLATVESFDPVANTWATELPLPHARYGAYAAAYGGKLVVVGGQRDQNHCEASVDVFDPAGGTWTTAPAQFGCCSWLAVADDQLFAGSGTEVSRATGPQLAGWHGLTPSQRLTSGGLAAATAGSIFVIAFGTAERYELAREIR